MKHMQNSARGSAATEIIPCQLQFYLRRVHLLIQSDEFNSDKFSNYLKIWRLFGAKNASINVALQYKVHNKVYIYIMWHTVLLYDPN